METTLPIYCEHQHDDSACGNIEKEMVLLKPVVGYEDVGATERVACLPCAEHFLDSGVATFVRTIRVAKLACTHDGCEWTMVFNSIPVARELRKNHELRHVFRD